MRGTIAVFTVVLLVACSEQTEDAQQAVNAAKAMMEMTKSAQEAGEAAEKASAEAEAAARAQIPEGASEEEARQFVENAKAMAALKAMGKVGGGKGPVTNWRQLAPFLPDELGDLTAAGELDGSTTKAAGMKVTTVERSYESGEKLRVNITVTDTFVAPMLRAPFAMAAMIEEDSTRGYKKGTKIGGHTAIVEWRKGSKRSSATMLVGERFIVDVKVRGTEDDGHAQKVAALLDLAGLAAVKGEEPKGEAPAGPTEPSDGE